jgi:hypothetical protein
VAFSHGKAASFSVGTAAIPATPTDITTYLTSISFPRSVDTAESSTFGDTSKSYLVGLSDGTISIEGKLDPTVEHHLADLAAQAHSLAGVALNFEYGPQGTTGGLPKYTGTCHLTSFEESTDIGDAASFSAEFQITGDVTRATY